MNPTEEISTDNELEEDGDHVKFYTEGVCDIKINSRSPGYEIWVLATDDFPVKLSSSNEDCIEQFFIAQINTGIRWKVERGDNDFSKLGQPIYAEIKNCSSNANFISVFENTIDEHDEKNWMIKIQIPEGIEKLRIGENFKLCQVFIHGQNVNHNSIRQYPVTDTGPFEYRSFKTPPPSSEQFLKVYVDDNDQDDSIKFMRKRKRDRFSFSVEKLHHVFDEDEPCFGLLKEFRWKEQILYLDNLMIDDIPNTRPAHYDESPDWGMTKQQFLLMKHQKMMSQKKKEMTPDEFMAKKQRFMKLNNVVEASFARGPPPPPNVPI